MGSMVHATMHIVDRADFANGVNTNGWTISAQSLTSPSYPTNVASFMLAGTNLSDGATLSVSYSQDTFTIVPSGGAQPLSFTAEYTISKLPPPAWVNVTNIIDGAFDVFWPPVEDAVGYRMTIFSNHVEGAADGTQLFHETFDSIPGKGSVTAIDAATFDGLTDTHAGWRIQTCYHAVEPASGRVQIGSSSAFGWMTLPVPQNCLGAGRTLRLAAGRFTNAGRDMPVSVISDAGSTTNAIGSIALGESIAEHHIALPELKAGDMIYLHSTTNKATNKDKDGRVLLDDVAILEGYDPGRTISECYASFDTADTAFSTNGFPPFAGTVAVTALSANRADDSDAAEAALDLAHPPAMPILRAFPLSVCTNGTYAADFSALSNVTAAMTWYNGVWPIPYWMGYNDKGQVVSSIRKATLGTTYSGFFAFKSEWDPTMGWALGFRGTSSRDFHYGIAFQNDTGAPRTGFELSMDYLQWNYRNEVPMTNTVEYLVTNELVGTSAPGAWISVPALAMTPPYTASQNDGGAEHWRQGLRSARLDGVILGTGSYLIIRMTDLRTSTSGGVGIIDFRLASVRMPAANCIIFR